MEGQVDEICMVRGSKHSCTIVSSSKGLFISSLFHNKTTPTWTLNSKSQKWEMVIRRTYVSNGLFIFFLVVRITKWYGMRDRVMTILEYVDHTLRIQQFAPHLWTHDHNSLYRVAWFWSKRHPARIPVCSFSVSDNGPWEKTPRALGPSMIFCLPVLCLHS